MRAWGGVGWGDIDIHVDITMDIDIDIIINMSRQYWYLQVLLAITSRTFSFCLDMFLEQKRRNVFADI